MRCSCWCSHAAAGREDATLGHGGRDAAAVDRGGRGVPEALGLREARARRAAGGPRGGLDPQPRRPRDVAL